MLNRTLVSIKQYNRIESNSDQITLRGNLVIGVSWNFDTMCQEGTVVFPDGQTRPAWRGGYEGYGEGWICR